VSRLWLVADGLLSIVLYSTEVVLAASIYGMKRFEAKFRRASWIRFQGCTGLHCHVSVLLPHIVGTEKSRLGGSTVDGRRVG
jgi:hypothetical protein